MLSYEELKLKPKTLRAMTSLRPSEFDALLDDFRDRKSTRLNSSH